MTRKLMSLIALSVLFSAATGVFADPPTVIADVSDTIQLSNLQNQFQTIADRVSPSVVAISAATVASDADDALRDGGINGPQLDQMLQHVTRTVGTGFFIDPDGYILTNEHVIADSGQIWITTDNQKVYSAIVVGSDPRADLAVLKIAAHDMPAVKFAAADAVHRGIWTIAIGNPYGLAGMGQMSMSVGIVSATDRSLPRLSQQEHRYYAKLIQTTAEINPGNSGGPLFDINGQVIGVSTAVILPQKQTNGIGFALPITNDLLAKVQDLKQGKPISYAYLGVMVSTPTAQQRHNANITDSNGVIVDAVDQDAPAAVAIHCGDIVVQVNDQSVSDSDQFIRSIGTTSVSQAAKFVLLRNGAAMTLYIQLRNREIPSVPVTRENQRIHWQGMTLGPTPANHGLAVITVDPASPMVSQGIHVGTVITSVAGKSVDSVIDLQNILSQTPPQLCKVEIQSQNKQAVAIGQ